MQIPALNEKLLVATIGLLVNPEFVFPDFVSLHPVCLMLFIHPA